MLHTHAISGSEDFTAESVLARHGVRLRDALQGDHRLSFVEATS